MRLDPSQRCLENSELGRLRSVIHGCNMPGELLGLCLIISTKNRLIPATGKHLLAWTKKALSLSSKMRGDFPGRASGSDSEPSAGAQSSVPGGGIEPVHAVRDSATKEEECCG